MDSAVPIGILVAFTFLMISASLAAVNIRLASQRRKAREVEDAVGQEKQNDERERIDALREAIKRHPELAGHHDPDSLEILSDHVERIRKEWRVQRELVRVKAEEAEASRLASQAAEAEARREELKERQRQREQEREQKISQMPPVRRFLARNSVLVAVVAAIFVAAFIAVVFWIGSMWQEKQEELARAVAEQEEREEREDLLNSCRAELAKSTRDTEIISALLACESEVTRVALVNNPSLELTHMTVLATDESSAVKRALVERTRSALQNESQASKEDALKVLRLLSSSEDEQVRSLIAGSIGITNEFLEDLASDPSPIVRGQVASNSRTDTRLLDRIPWEDSVDVATRLADRSNASPDLLVALAAHPNEQVRSRVARNPKAPIDALEILLEDESQDVIEGLTYTPTNNEFLSPKEAKRVKDEACMRYQEIERAAFYSFTAC